MASGTNSNMKNMKDTNRATKTLSFKLRNLIYRKTWDEVEQECQCNPSQAKVADKLGDLPLHEACLQAAPFHVIKNLLSVHPAGVKEKGFCGRLPLHYASYNRPSLNVIKLLLKNYPEGASVIDSDGRLPVHLAVVRNAPKEAILILISAYPKSLYMTNKFGSTPQMLASNQHIESILEEEEVRPRNVEQTIDAVKKFKMVWTAENGIVSKNEKIKLKNRPHTTGRIASHNNSLYKHTPHSSSSLLIDIGKSLTHNKQQNAKNKQKRIIFKRGGGKQIPPPPGVIFETVRTSIPTPPTTPSPGTPRPVTLVREAFPFNKTFSQPYTPGTKVELAILV